MIDRFAANKSISRGVEVILGALSDLLHQCLDRSIYRIPSPHLLAGMVLQNIFIIYAEILSLDVVLTASQYRIHGWLRSNHSHIRRDRDEVHLRLREMALAAQVISDLSAVDTG